MWPLTPISACSIQTIQSPTIPLLKSLSLVYRPTKVSLSEYHQLWSELQMPEDDVQTVDLQYTPFIRPTDQPAIEMNADIMDEFREEMQPFYFDSKRYDSYLEQLGVSYPTLRQPDGQCRIGSISDQGAGGV